MAQSQPVWLLERPVYCRPKGKTGWVAFVTPTHSSITLTGKGSSCALSKTEAFLGAIKQTSQKYIKQDRLFPIIFIEYFKRGTNITYDSNWNVILYRGVESLEELG